MNRALGVFFLLLISRSGIAGIDPIRLTAKIMAIYVSSSPYCTSPILFFSKSAPIAYDVFAFPVLGSTDNSTGQFNGVYPCVIFKMSERLDFRPGTPTDNCIFDNDYSVDVCNSSHVNTGVDGSTSNCSSTPDETVYLYLSTASATDDPDAATQPFSPPTPSDNSKGIRMSSPFYIRGLSAGRLVIDGRNRITGSRGVCTMAMPRFSFVNE
jgi:hypothetical protein